MITFQIYIYIYIYIYIHIYIYIYIIYNNINMITFQILYIYIHIYTILYIYIYIYLSLFYHTQSCNDRSGVYKCVENQLFSIKTWLIPHPMIFHYWSPIDTRTFVISFLFLHLKLCHQQAAGVFQFIMPRIIPVEFP